jgi:hypothetical protein
MNFVLFYSYFYSKPDTNKLSPEHPARKYPEWIIKYGDLLVFNPGINSVFEFSKTQYNVLLKICP